MTLLVVSDTKSTCSCVIQKVPVVVVSRSGAFLAYRLKDSLSIRRHLNSRKEAKTAEEVRKWQPSGIFSSGCDSGGLRVPHVRLVIDVSNICNGRPTA